MDATDTKVLKVWESKMRTWTRQMMCPWVQIPSIHIKAVHSSTHLYPGATETWKIQGLLVNHYS